ncbi:DUF2851 family protein [Ekhidna sp.]|uniref:DUF2851 family protein n=1 Tax=Ekhidna sp. TaxID=2608089 RepID=UPI003C7ABAC3
MDEQFLHYIWKFQKFEQNELKLTDNQTLKVFYPGNHNQDSGPDFEEARIKIDSIEWAGQVEIHLHSSDWNHHNHQHDPAYKNVILHVVWKHDKGIQLNGTPIPTLELKSIVSPTLLEKYKKHIQSTQEILCANQLLAVSPLPKTSMLDRTMVERLEEKADRIFDHLKNNRSDWEDATYRTLAANFGFSTNKEAFVRLTELLPFAKLKKALQNKLSTEALLFGQAGFLNEENDEYQGALKSEFQFLQNKYHLPDMMVKPQWKFGKLRPANFPSVRLAQLAALLHHQPKLFTILTQTEGIKELKTLLCPVLSEYWQTHYDFGKGRKKIINHFGQTTFENILINTVAPLLAAYARHTANPIYMDRAIELLESLSAESNRITKKWDEIGLESKTAFDSQALIQLFKNYCQKRRCLQCNIGVEILNR